uniref:Cytochrome c biogenesis protein Ccs1 n=1 Tax=Caloglossa intermedia TaxID=100879 RepID=A0A1Z1M5M3_9FLOR|nr:cytochrome c biogenesis protein ccs1 [Caloglossa intermedia]ARW61377.1 cytochrome c biogenesis protein ccs1 [Caloglossa intermedia]
MKSRNIVWLFFKRLSNLNFSIGLLSLISFFIMIGSVVEQNQDLSYYQTYYPIMSDKIFSVNWQLILFFGLDHLYQTWWFIFSLVAFVSSLLVCTFSTQLPSLQNSRRWKFSSSISGATNICRELKSREYNLKNSSINAIYVLDYFRFYVFHKKEYLYAYRGLLGRLAPIFVHFAMIFILLGSMLNVLLGYTAQEIIPNGEVFHVKNVINSGFYSKLRSSFTCKIDDFFLQYNPDNSINQFFSVLSVLDNRNQTIVSKKIFVNSPLRFNGLTFYQTDWNVNSVRLFIGSGLDLILQLKLLKINISGKSCWLCKVPLENDKLIYLILFDLNNKIIISNSSGFIFGSVYKNQAFYINNVPLEIKEIILDTGLQIKTDSGIEIVYFGFFVLMLTTIVSYISYSQIWIYAKNSLFSFSGSTNRAVLFFEEDIAKINFFYSYYTFSKPQIVHNSRSFKKIENCE